MKVAARVTSLGTGLGAGTRRNMVQLHKRLNAFKLRRGRFSRLRSSRVDTSRLLRTGGNSAMLFGLKPLGVSDALLLKQRRAAVAATRVWDCGASLDISLLVADGKTARGAADPAFEAHCGVLHMWALAVWEHWVPSSLLNKVVNYAVAKLDRAKVAWGVVYGPAAAMVATARRLNWQVNSAVSFCTDEGRSVDLQIDSPAYVLGVVRDSMSRWRWRRIEACLPGLVGNTPGLGAAWGPVCKVVWGKSNEDWKPEHRGALKSAICGRQWTQQRLYKAGLAENNLCKLCEGLPGGDQVGTLLHRYSCPALEPFRKRHMPAWIENHLQDCGGRPSSSVLLALTRGLFPAPHVESRSADLYDTIVWTVAVAEIPSGCVLFTDGSLLDGKLGPQCHALGWAFAVVAKDGALVAAAHGVPPAWIDTIQGAELWAVRTALVYALFPAGIMTDCMSVVTGVRQPKSWAGSSRRRFARVWLHVQDQLEGRGDLVQWMPAHLSQDLIGQRVCSDGVVVDDSRWAANQIADLLAKEAAELVRVPVSTRAWLKLRDKQLVQLLEFLGKLTFEAGHCVRSDGRVCRDSDSLPCGRPCLKKGRSKSKGRGLPGNRPLTRAPRNDGAGWVEGWNRRCAGKVPSSAKVLRVSKSRSSSSVISSRQEIAFQHWWREARVDTLRPRACDAPSASHRIEALRQRVRNRVSTG